MKQAYFSTVINAPVKEVWDQIKDYNGLATWHPMVAGSEIEGGGPANRIGAIRRLTLKNEGNPPRETLLAYSDLEHMIVYDVVESDMAIHDYISTIKLTPVTDGDLTFAEWSVKFEPDDGEDGEKWVDFFANEVYGDGLRNLKEIMGV